MTRDRLFPSSRKRPYIVRSGESLETCACTKPAANRPRPTMIVMHCRPLRFFESTGRIFMSSPKQAARVLEFASRLRHPLENSSRPHAPSYAHRHQPVSHISPFHFVQKSRRQLGARAPEGMAERNGSPVDIESVLIHRKLAEAREYLRGERFVELDQIDLIQRQPGDLERFPDRRHGADPESFGFYTGGSKRDEAPKRRQPLLASTFGGCHN